MTPLDIRSLAVFRICLGLMLISDLAERMRYAGLYLTTRANPPGWLPDSLSNLWLRMADDETMFIAFLAVTMVASCFYLAGYKTRWAAIVTWVLVLLLHTFQPRVLNGGDKVLRLLLFWSMFLPIGKRFSLDARISPQSKDEPTEAPLLISLALMIQVAAPYVMSALHKVASEHWLDGYGLYFSFIRDDEAKALALMIAAWPLPVLKVLNFAVLAVELFAPVLMFSRVATDRMRLAFVFIFVGLHAGMHMTLEVGRFTTICSSGVLALLPSSIWGGRIPLPAEQQRWFRGPMDYLLAALVALMVIWNVSTLPKLDWLLPKPVRKIGHTAGLQQGFKMYSGVREEGGWFTLPGRLADGSYVDFFRKGQPLDKERPEVISATFMSEHWRKLIERTTSLRDYPTMKRLADYYCRTWNQEHSGEKAMQSFEIVFTHQVRFRDGSRSEPSDEVVFSRDCSF